MAQNGDSRVWERVAPSLPPYPGDEPRPIPAGAVVRSVTGERIGGPRPEKPSAPVDPETLTQFIEAERSEQRHLTALSRQAPAWAGRDLGQIAAACTGRARRLSAAYYLLTGEAYRPDERGERIYTGRWPQALRERCQNLSRLGRQYARAAGETEDPFLKKLFHELSEGAYRNAADLLRLLERGLEAKPEPR